jgi:uncharacterized membrane protein
MNKSRLEAFSDGVLAIIVTIMVLELKVPHTTDFHALIDLIPVFISYLLSFVFLGIYWGNHHHLMHTVHHVNSKIIWANLHLLFWLSLIPFATAWMGENSFRGLPVACYGLLLLLCAIAYFILQKAIARHYTHSTRMIEALAKQQKKGYISLVLYLVAVPTALYFPRIAALLYLIVAIMWVIPDKNIEKVFEGGETIK